MPAGVIFNAHLGNWFIYVVKSEHLIEYHIDRRKGSVFWNVFCPWMSVKYCSVIGVNDFAGVFSAGPSSLVVSLHSSIWYYLALIELSSIASLSPPSALLLSSFPLLPARDRRSLVFRRGANVFSLPSVFPPITSALSLYSSLSMFSPPLFSPPSPPLPVWCSPCVSHSLPQSIINFNLRAGLNGTIRERSMLSIWMPARLDLGIPHRRRRSGKIAVFPSLVHHIHTSLLIQIIDQTPECKLR